ncbi:MAG TPA: alpha/beta family hydrolase [Anaerolineales bacterium]|nr:alpha/beta family hydrolase [Anaerolineales bacterium]
MNLSSLDVVGYQNQQVPATFIAHPNPANHLGIILPGYRYAAEMPPLHYAGRVLLNQGADLLRVEYAYYRTDFQQRPEHEQDKWISSDVLAACEAGLARRQYEKITLVGKSLGTIAMGHLLSDSRFQKATCVWLTPILTVEWLCSRIEQLHPRSLFVIGTADQFYKPDLLKQLQHATHGQVVVLEGVDHSLELPGDIPQSLRILDQIVQALQTFLQEPAKSM